MVKPINLRDQADDITLFNYYLRVNALLSVVSENLQVVQAPNVIKTILIGNGNLYQIAAQEYNDATKWKTIADINGLNDPWITDFIQLTVPTLSGAST